MPGAAYIISWNVWQMDGLTYGLPGHTPRKPKEKPKVVQGTFNFSDDFTSAKEDEQIGAFERFCLVKDFLEGINLQKATLCSKDFHDQSAVKHTFESVLNK